jgi:hypothetical protein
MLRYPSLPLPRRHGVRLLSKPQTGLARFPLCQFENTLGLGTSSIGAENLGISHLTVSTDPAGSRASPPPTASSRKQDMAGLPRSPQHPAGQKTSIPDFQAAQTHGPGRTPRGAPRETGKLVFWEAGPLVALPSPRCKRRTDDSN